MGGSHVVVLVGEQPAPRTVGKLSRGRRPRRGEDGFAHDVELREEEARQVDLPPMIAGVQPQPCECAGRFEHRRAGVQKCRASSCLRLRAVRHPRAASPSAGTRGSLLRRCRSPQAPVRHGTQPGMARSPAGSGVLVEPESPKESGSVGLKALLARGLLHQAIADKVLPAERARCSKHGAVRYRSVHAGPHPPAKRAREPRVLHLLHNCSCCSGNSYNIWSSKRHSNLTRVK